MTIYISPKMSSKRRSKASFDARFKKIRLEESPDEILTITDEEPHNTFKRSTTNTRKTYSKIDRNTPVSVTISSPDSCENKTLSGTFSIGQDDKVRSKVDIIIKDVKNNTLRSLTIEGSGLGIEKTISVVEELKQHFSSHGTEYQQDTSISSNSNNQPHLVVILKDFVEKSK